MQTFLPFESFQKSAEVLDGKRLWKQRVETMQILQTLSGISQGWKNHPAVKMWKGFENFLLDYQAAIITEGLSRGYKDNVCWDKSVAAYALVDNIQNIKPHWLGDESVHASHRSNLLRKNPDWYSNFGWNDSPDQEYVWPV
jgi:hypothetical protein